MMHTCPLCQAEYASVSAMLTCNEQCERETRNTREWFARKDPNHRI